MISAMKRGGQENWRDNARYHRRFILKTTGVRLHCEAWLF